MYSELLEVIKNNDSVYYKITKIKGDRDYMVGYWAIGRDLFLKVGYPINMFRVANSDNPDGKYGTFTSSEVLSIERGVEFDTITTFNSTYKIEQLNSVMSVIGKKIRAEGLGED